jgi:hypothetical protein
MEVTVRSLVARSKVAVVELHMDLEQAAQWIRLVDSKVSLAIGSIVPSPTSPRRAAIVKQSQEREVTARVSEEMQRDKAKTEKVDKKPKTTRKKKDKVRDKLRAQMPDGWLLLHDFAAQTCRPVKTIRRWANSKDGGKIRKRDVRQVPVKNFKQPTVTAIRASLVPGLTSSRRGRGKKIADKRNAPIRALVERVGLSGAVELTGLQRATLEAAYHEPSLLVAVPNSEKIAQALASVMALEDARGVAREDGDDEEDTSQEVPMRDEEPVRAEQAAWEESR